MERDVVYEVVKKLVGDINPIGETTLDNKRYENLKELIDVVDTLVSDIRDMVIRNRGMNEYSIKRAVDEAEKFLAELKGM